MMTPRDMNRATLGQSVNRATLGQSMNRDISVPSVPFRV